jgi:hypothetical protein
LLMSNPFDPSTAESREQAYPQVVDDLKNGTYVCVSGGSENVAALSDRIIAEFGDTHKVMRVDLNAENNTPQSVLDGLAKLEPEIAAKKVKPIFSDVQNINGLMCGVARESERPIILMINDLQIMTDVEKRRDIIRTVRALFHGRVMDPNLNKLTVLLSADQPINNFLNDQRTPYNIGTKYAL